MPRYLISLGYIPNTPTNRFLAEWVEVGSLLYFSMESGRDPTTTAVVCGGLFTAYDGWMNKKLGV